MERARERVEEVAERVQHVRREVSDLMHMTESVVVNLSLDVPSAKPAESLVRFRQTMSHRTIVTLEFSRNVTHDKNE